MSTKERVVSLTFKKITHTSNSKKLNIIVIRHLDVIVMDVVFTFHLQYNLVNFYSISFDKGIKIIHTLRVQYAHDAANLNSELSKYAKVARVHHFCTITLRTLYARVSVAYGAFTRA